MIRLCVATLALLSTSRVLAQAQPESTPGRGGDPVRVSRRSLGRAGLGARHPSRHDHATPSAYDSRRKRGLACSQGCSCHGPWATMLRSSTRIGGWGVQDAIRRLPACRGRTFMPDRFLGMKMPQSYKGTRCPTSDVATVSRWVTRDSTCGHFPRQPVRASGFRRGAGLVPGSGDTTGELSTGLKDATPLHLRSGPRALRRPLQAALRHRRADPTEEQLFVHAHSSRAA